MAQRGGQGGNYNQQRPQYRQEHQRDVRPRYQENDRFGRLEPQYYPPERPPHPQGPQTFRPDMRYDEREYRQHNLHRPPMHQTEQLRFQEGYEPQTQHQLQHQHQPRPRYDDRIYRPPLYSDDHYARPRHDERPPFDSRPVPSHDARPPYNNDYHWRPFMRQQHELELPRQEYRQPHVQDTRKRRYEDCILHSPHSFHSASVRESHRPISPLPPQQWPQRQSSRSQSRDVIPQEVPAAVVQESAKPERIIPKSIAAAWAADEKRRVDVLRESNFKLQQASFKQQLKVAQAAFELQQKELDLFRFTKQCETYHELYNKYL